jgi:hypothetical protein
VALYTQSLKLSIARSIASSSLSKSGSNNDMSSRHALDLESLRGIAGGYKGSMREQFVQVDATGLVYIKRMGR